MSEQEKWEEQMESFINALKGISYFRILFQHIDELEKELSELKKRNEELEGESKQNIKEAYCSIMLENNSLRKKLSEAKKEVCEWKFNKKQKCIETDCQCLTVIAKDSKPLDGCVCFCGKKIKEVKR